MKKTLILGLILMLVLSLAACGGNDSAGGSSSNDGAENENGGKTEKIKLSIWHNYSGDDLRAKAIRGQIEQFEKNHPEVQLDKQPIPPDGYRQRLKTVAAADEMPDVFVMYPGNATKEFYDAGLIQPITSLLDSHPEWRDNFLEGAYDTYKFGNDVYAMPNGLSPTSIVYYNQSLFDKYNVKVPTTWDELMIAIKVFNENDITPISLGNKASWVAQSCIIGTLADRITGTDWFLKAVAQDGAKFTDPEFVEALTYFKKLVDAKAFQEGANSIDNTQAEQYFIQGQAAMVISGSWTLTNLAATATEEQLAQVGVTVFPEIPGGKGNSNTLSGVTGTGFALNKKVDGARRDAALELIYALSGPETQQAVAESSSTVNYKVELDETKVTPMFKKTFDLLQGVNFTPVYDAHLSSAGTEAINNGLQELLLGGNPEDVAKKLQDAHAKALQQ